MVTSVPGAGAAQAVSDALETLGPTASGVHDRDDGSGLWEVSGYFDGRPDPTALALIAAAHGGAGFAVAPVGSRDWMAQVRAGLSPVRAGRFVVFGSHDRVRVPVNLVGLEIEAALAFGTGHHATTRGCLLGLDRLARRGWQVRRAADIGAGTGVLAMAAARVFACSVLAADIDGLATATARDNAAANRLAGRIRCLTAPGFRHPALAAAAPFDLVTANILAGPLRRLVPDMARHAAVGGVVVLSGILERQAASVEATYRGWGFRRLTVIGVDGWSTLVMRRGVGA